MNNRGFTFPEVIISLAVFSIVSGMGAALFGSSIPTLRANSQMSRVVGLVQMGRANAIRRQRDIEMRFDATTSSIRLIRSDAGVEVPVAEVFLEYGVGLRTFETVDEDTPDQFGDASATDFEGAERLFFISDGSLVDEDGLPTDGTIFLGMSGQPSTARAVTVTGATARPRPYRWITDTWIAQ